MNRRQLLGAVAVAPLAIKANAASGAESELIVLCREAVDVSDKIDAAYFIQDGLRYPADIKFEREVLDPLYDRRNGLEKRIAALPATTLEELQFKARVTTWSPADLKASGHVVEHSVLRDLIAMAVG